MHREEDEEKKELRPARGCFVCNDEDEDCLKRCPGCYKWACMNCMQSMKDSSIFGDGYLCEDCVRTIINVGQIVARRSGKSVIGRPATKLHKK
jgi:hypothetical protein